LSLGMATSFMLFSTKVSCNWSSIYYALCMARVTTFSVFFLFHLFSLLMLESSQFLVQSYFYNTLKAIRVPTSCLLANEWLFIDKVATLKALNGLFYVSFFSGTDMTVIL
jgi:hypothetical protein